MKRVVLNSILITFITLGFTACKDGKESESGAESAKEVSEMSKDESAKTYQVMPQESKILWKGNKAVGSGHNGTIQLKNGKFQVKNGKITSGMAVIDMTSIEAEDLKGSPEKKKKLETHLMGTSEEQKTDFFNVQEYPEATFEVTGYDNQGDQNILSGNLTIKDKTKNISFPVTTSMSQDGKMMTLSSETFTIDRTDWGVQYGSGSVFDNLTKDQVINDEIELTLDLKMKRS